MKPETIEKILNFLKEKENKELPKKWKLIHNLENHPDDIQYRYEGDLNLNNKNITKLPNDLYVDGFLSLDGCEQLTKLPDNLYVDGWLRLEKCPQLTKLPDKLYVGKTLVVPKTNIKELPDNLYVGGNLFLLEVSIEELPDNLYVGNDLHIYGTPLANKYTNEEIRDIVASTGGVIIGKIIR